MSTTNSKDKPHRAVVMVWLVAAPVALVSHLMRGGESTTNHGWHLAGCVFMIVLSGILLRARRAVRVRKAEIREDIAERDRIVTGGILRAWVWLMSIGTALKLVVAIGNAVVGRRENWLENAREISSSLLMAIVIYNIARVNWPASTNGASAANQPVSSRSEVDENRP